MDRREWTRIGTGITAALAALFGAGWLANRIYVIRYPAENAYQVPGAEAPPVDLAALQRAWPSGLDQPGGRTRLLGYMGKIDRAVLPASLSNAAPVAAEPVPDLGTLLANADIQQGKRTAQVCTSCHSLDQGGSDRTGPNLWGIVGRDIAAHQGFAYSSAVAAQPGSWTWEKLDQWLASPARAVPGNKMTFGGVRRPQDRANLLRYLGTLGGALPLPPPEAAKGRS